MGIVGSVLLDAELKLLAVYEPLDLDGEGGISADDVIGLKMLKLPPKPPPLLLLLLSAFSSDV